VNVDQSGCILSDIIDVDSNDSRSDNRCVIIYVKYCVVLQHFTNLHSEPLTYSRNDENVTYDVLVRRYVPEKDRISYRFQQKKYQTLPFV